MAFDELLLHYLEPIAALLRRNDIADIFIDRWDYVYYSAGGQYHDTDIRWRDEKGLLDTINQVANQAAGVVLSPDRPFIDARLSDGSRVAASIPPLSSHPQMTIRVARDTHLSMLDLVPRMLSSDMASFLEGAVAGYQNVLIAGPMDSGKTTVLRALVWGVVETDRIFLVEDTAELKLPLRRAISHEVDRNNVAKLTMGDSIRASLRQAPTRMVVGEIRDEDALKAYLEALEAGIRGALTTMHADSAAGALHRAEMILMRRGNVASLESARHMVRSAIDVIAYCEKSRKDGVRRVAEIAAVVRGEPVLLWRWDGDHFAFDEAARARLG